MALSDPYRVVVGAGGVVLVGVLTLVRFCGSLSLPPKPPAPTGPTGTARQLLSQSANTQPAYVQFLAGDAHSAGLHVPSLDDMAKKLAYASDERSHVLNLGEPPVEAAGLRIRLERSGDLAVMRIENRADTDLAYNVISAPSIAANVCNSATPLPFNAMMIAKGTSETRTECVWRDGVSVVVTKIETMEVPALSAWYLAQLPPALVGIEPRIARGHRGIATKQSCAAITPATVRSGLERGEIGWRDLVDFYARHRCQTYQFPSSYRAFKFDGERALPAAAIVQ